jgi:DNA-binding transcriptional ArsR family regulator
MTSVVLMGVISRVMQVVSLSVLLVSVTLLIHGVNYPHTSNPTLTYIVLDSCSYEVARDLVKKYPELHGRILFPVDLNETIESPLVVLATNISRGEYSDVVGYLSRFNGLVASTDVVSSKEALNSSDLWSYCLYGDQEALERVANGIIESVKTQQSTTVLAPTIGVLAIATVAASVFIASSWDDIKDVIRRIKIPLPLIIPIILRQKVSVEDALNHPIRLKIYELVRSNGAVPFSKVLELGGKAVVEWHTFILTRSGLVIELKIGRSGRKKRYLVIPNPEVLSKILPKLDERVECVITNRVKPPEKIADVCNLDTQSVISILRLVGVITYSLNPTIKPKYAGINTQP